MKESVPSTSGEANNMKSPAVILDATLPLDLHSEMFTTCVSVSTQTDGTACKSINHIYVIKYVNIYNRLVISAMLI